MADREPWQCPSCLAWIRPDVEAHWCDGPDGGVTEGRPVAPKSPFTGASVTWTFPPGTVTTTNTGGTAYALTIAGGGGARLAA